MYLKPAGKQLYRTTVGVHILESTLKSIYIKENLILKLKTNVDMLIIDELRAVVS